MYRNIRLVYGMFAMFCLVLGSGCAGREVPREPDALPPIFTDAVFLEAIRNIGTRGGAGITVVAPSSGPTERGARMIRAMAGAIGASFPENALGGSVPYNANEDAARLASLAEALANSETEVIWAALGGYGSSRLLEGLSRLPADTGTKKILVGYSDTTFLHLYFQKKGWRTVHGALFWELASSRKDPENFSRLAELLAGKVAALRYGGLEPRNHAARNLSRPVRGLLTGGNLTCLAAAGGTPWALDAVGKILFLEDVKEPGYKIDRMLVQLRDSGGLSGVKAIVLGTFTAGDQFTEYALERFAETCGVPVFASDLFGHGAKNYPLVFNAPATVAKGPGGRFELVVRVDSLP